MIALGLSRALLWAAPPTAQSSQEQSQVPTDEESEAIEEPFTDDEVVIKTDEG